MLSWLRCVFSVVTRQASVEEVAVEQVLDDVDVASEPLGDLRDCTFGLVDCLVCGERGPSDGSDDAINS